MNTLDYEVGDRVRYSPFAGDARTVIVTGKEADIKNGEPGFDGYVVQFGDQVDYSRMVWGYDRQITGVNKLNHRGELL